MSESTIIQTIERRVKRLAIHLGKDPAEMLEQIQSYTVSGTVAADKTGTTFATACAGDATAAGDGTSGDHLAIEPNKLREAWAVVGVYNLNSDAETETWGIGDYRSGDTNIPFDEHDSASSLSQRRKAAGAFSVNSAGAGMDCFPYASLPAAVKDSALKISLFNIAAASAEQTFTGIVFYVPVPLSYKAPGPMGICKPCRCG